MNRKASRAAGALRRPGVHALSRHSSPKGLQSRTQLLRCASPDRKALDLVDPARVRREGDVADIVGRGSGQHRVEPACQLRKGRQAAGAQGQEMHRASGLRPQRERQRRRRFLENDVSVRAAESKRADPGPPGRLASLPRVQTPGDREPRPLQVDVGAQSLQVQVGRNRAVLELEYGLDQPGDPGGGLEVPDVGLDGADEAGAVPLRQGRLDRLELDRVTQHGSRPVGLDVSDRSGRRPGIAQRLADHAHLGAAIRGGDPVARAVLVHGAAADHGQDAVPVAQRLVQGLEHDHAASLTADVTVRRGVERPAPAAGREHLAQRECVEEVGREDQVDAPHQGERALPVPQALARQVDGGERR